MSYASAADTAQSTDRRTEKELLTDIRKSLAGADEISNRTLETLNSQTEQLQRIQGHADGIEHNLDQSEFLLRGLKRWGWVRNIFKGPRANQQEKLQQMQQRQQQQQSASWGLDAEGSSEPVSVLRPRP
mmetsp:Transcript_102769/g.266190  ORF Transcript_102769/g.266190 Transcript_102769/m.266190 type:complete len:129 (-) Transcript_102769:519-905(-)